MEIRTDINSLNGEISDLIGCVEDPIPSYVTDQENIVLCDPGCLTCDASGCLTCMDTNTTPVNGFCQISAADANASCFGYSAVSGADTCATCDPSCRTCSTAADNTACTSCFGTFVLDSGTCISKPNIPSSFRCIAGCSNCTSRFTCDATGCIDGYEFNDSSSTCDKISIAAPTDPTFGAVAKGKFLDFDTGETLDCDENAEYCIEASHKATACKPNTTRVHFQIYKDEAAFSTCRKCPINQTVDAQGDCAFLTAPFDACAVTDSKGKCILCNDFSTVID
jgi:hypothetical protein